jgi:hypothetical protein
VENEGVILQCSFDPGLTEELCGQGVFCGGCEKHLLPMNLMSLFIKLLSVAGRTELEDWTLSVSESWAVIKDWTCRLHGLSDFPRVALFSMLSTDPDRC